ncbi:MAG TPA: Coq4 family protein [Rhizomicrobium sp.]|jgi:ubiquinone biosynthesis protein COQ4|nr:Coq4 family protein [Rhizomicrobium sp.]
MAATAQNRNDRKQWGEAFSAMRLLLADPNDTVQVFRVMQALNGGTSSRNYRRLLTTPEGGRIAYKREELVAKLTDRQFLSQFAPGTVGAAYRDFLAHTGFSADGLEAVSKEVERDGNDEHPHAWMGRRERDLHDIWHTLTGYQANAPLGELCLVAFSYAQNTGLGWAFIALSGALKNLTEPHRRDVWRAVWEGYRNGRNAKWLHKEDIDTLFAEPLDAARKRLNILEPLAYRRAQAEIGASPAQTWIKAAA